MTVFAFIVLICVSLYLGFGKAHNPDHTRLALTIFFAAWVALLIGA